MISPKNEQVRILHRAVHSIHPAPENEDVYHPVLEDDPEIVELARSIREHGVQEPLVISEDGYILSGHHRHMAARVAGLQDVPVIVHPVHHGRNQDEFVTLLRECNRQRVKSFDEKLREEIISADPEEAYRALVEHREEQSAVVVDTMTIRKTKQRARITKAKQPMIDAIKDIIRNMKTIGR